MEEKLCPNCGLKMLQVDTGTCLPTNPPQYPWYWWCGGCNHSEEGGVKRGQWLTLKEQWERLNRED